MTAYVIEEQGVVVANEPDHVVVEVLKTSACQSCKAKQGCGQAVLSQFGDEMKQAAKNHFLIPYHQPLPVGAGVTLEMSAEVVSKVALLLYIVPLLVGFVGMLFSNSAGLSEPWQLLVFLVCLVSTYFVLGRLSAWRKQVFVPRIKTVLLSTPDLIATQAIQSKSLLSHKS